MSTKTLRRYTDINALIYFLKHKAITLLDPSIWRDTNDSFSLSEYKKKKQLKTLLALCFAQAIEKYQHWHVFAHGQSGVCISFVFDNFINSISSHPGVRHGDVKYLTLRKYQDNIDSWNIEDLPFINVVDLKMRVNIE